MGYILPVPADQETSCLASVYKNDLGSEFLKGFVYLRKSLASLSPHTSSFQPASRNKKITHTSFHKFSRKKPL